MIQEDLSKLHALGMKDVLISEVSLFSLPIYMNL